MGIRCYIENSSEKSIIRCSLLRVRSDCISIAFTISNCIMGRTSRKSITERKGGRSDGTGTTRCLAVSLIACLLLVVGGTDARGQVLDPYGEDRERASNPQSSIESRPSGFGSRGETSNRRRSEVENLPDWAESHGSRRQTPSSRQGPGISSSARPMSSHGPGRPGVPVDGGLVWLMVAGAGYGVYRLRAVNGDR